MSALARLAVRLMDRTRMVDEFEMGTMSYDPALIVLEASAYATSIAGRVSEAPSPESIARAAIALAHDQVMDDGFSVRTRLLDGNWLLLVRIDQRTGPALRHPEADLPTLAMAA